MKFFIYALAAATVVAALPGGEPATGGSNTVNKTENKCNVGKLTCCQQTHSATSKQGADLLGLVGVAVGAVQALVGANCTPITGIGASGTSCSAQPVCCKKVDSKSLVGVNCSPVNVNV